MMFKNITKKNINILQNGQMTIIKPQQIIDGDKAVFEKYKGLLKINNPKLVVPKLPLIQDTITVEFIIVDIIN